MISDKDIIEKLQREYEAKLAAKDAEIAQKDVEIVQKDAEIVQKDAEIVQKDAESKAKLAEKDAEIERLKKVKVQDKEIHEAIEAIYNKSTPALQAFRNQLRNYYLSSQENLTPDESSMFRRAHLLSHLGIYFQDAITMPNIGDILEKTPGIEDINIEFPSIHANKVGGSESISEFFQVSNAGKPEANIVFLWNSIFLNMLMKLQAKDSATVPKLILESEYDFTQVPTLKKPLIADSVLKGLIDGDYPVCVIEYGAYPLDHYLHHKDVTKMAYMLASILYQRANQHGLYGSEQIENLRAYGMLIEDVDVEFCMAQIVSGSNNSMMVQFTCGSGNYRYHLYEGKISSFELFQGIEPVSLQSRNQSISQQEIANQIQSDIISSTDISIEPEPEAEPVRKRQKKGQSAAFIREAAMRNRRIPRTPNRDTLKHLAGFIQLSISQLRFTSSLPLKSNDKDKDKIQTEEEYHLSEKVISLVESSRSAASTISPTKISNARYDGIQGGRKHSAYIVSVNEYIERDDEDGYIECAPGVLSISDAFKGPFISKPGAFLIEMARLLLDLISATCSLHQAGYASIEYSRESIFWQSYYVIGGFSQVLSRNEVDPETFEALAAQDFVNLGAFLNDFTLFTSQFSQEMFSGEFDEEHELISNLLNFISVPTASESEKLKLALDTCHQISVVFHFQEEQSSPSFSLAEVTYANSRFNAPPTHEKDIMPVALLSPTKRIRELNPHQLEEIDIIPSLQPNK